MRLPDATNIGVCVSGDPHCFIDPPQPTPDLGHQLGIQREISIHVRRLMDDSGSLRIGQRHGLVITRRLIGASVRVILLEPTPHSRPPSGAEPDVHLHSVNLATSRYAAVMRQIAAECDAGVVGLFQPMLEMEQRLSRREPADTLYGDEVHLNLMGDLMYSQLVLDFLVDQWR